MRHYVNEAVWAKLFCGQITTPRYKVQPQKSIFPSCKDTRDTHARLRRWLTEAEKLTVSAVLPKEHRDDVSHVKGVSLP